jgi:hypothetical protein
MMMTRIEELKDKRNDNARHFVDFPEVVFFDQLSDHLEKLPGLEIVEFEMDGVVAVWLEFDYAGNHFFVDNHLADFRFFVEHPDCEEDILLAIAGHLRVLLEKSESGQ